MRNHLASTDQRYYRKIALKAMDQFYFQTIEIAFQSVQRPLFLFGEQFQKPRNELSICHFCALVLTTHHGVPANK